LNAPVLYNQVISICRNRNYKPRIINLYNRAEAVLLSVAAGIGISILPDNITKVFFSDKVEIIPIEGDDTIRTNMVFWNKRTVNNTTSKFLEVLRELYPTDKDL
jgi:DNA-binding transcriptional LysR family regulator